MKLTKQILATLTIAIVTSELFYFITTFQGIALSTEPKVFGSNDYLHIKNKELKEDKETKEDYKEDFNSKDISKKFIHRYIHSLSRYLSRGLRYEKNSSLELVGNDILSLLRVPDSKSAIQNSEIKQKTALVIDSPVNKKVDTSHVNKVYTAKVTDTLEKSLSTLVMDSKLEVVILTHGTFIDLSDTSRMQKLVGPILSGKADLVGSTIIDEQGKWKLGCYLKKILWFQYRIYNGYDLKASNKADGYLDCDYIGGAFAIRKDILKDFLNIYKKISPSYASLFNYMADKDMVIKLCVNCVSVQQTASEKLFPYNRAGFANFLVANKLSKFIPPHDKALELECAQAKINCWPLKGKGILISKCCIKELDDLLLNTLKEMDSRKWSYNLIAGTLIGSIKLEQTLPWELDHDFQLSSDKLLPLKSLSGTFIKKYGYRFIYELYGKFPNCVKSKGYICGWIGIKSKNWRLEVPGRGTLYSDINRIGADVTQATTYQNSHVKTNCTLSLMSGYWVQSLSNPGNYLRLKYGKNFLKHVKHIISNGLSRDANYLKRSVYKWTDCARPGYHACHSELPVDGNLGYRDVWV